MSAKKRVLSIDDDPNVRTLVQSILGDVGYEVVSAESGPKAIEILAAEPNPVTFSLIVLDVMMPEMNGFDVLTRIRLQPRTQGVPVIMLTGEARPEDILTGYNVGADYYITKPFTRSQLLYGVELVLSKDG